MALVLPSFTQREHHASYSSISPKNPALSLTGKTVLITGAGSGIGARAVQSFAEAGAAHIAILGRRKNKLDETASKLRPAFPDVKFYVYSVDITDKDAVKAAFEDYAKVAGLIDVLVSNAGSGDVLPLIKDVDADEWLAGLDTNVKGSFFVVKAYLAGYGKEDGVIINVSSGFSFLQGPHVSAYAVSKEAAVRIFQIISMENPALRIVSVQPGIVDTEMSRKANAVAQDDAALPADFFVWLSSPEAAFLKGKYVFANWDVEELKERQQEIKEKRLLEMWLQGFPFGGTV